MAEKRANAQGGKEFWEGPIRSSDIAWPPEMGRLSSHYSQIMNRSGSKSVDPVESLRLVV